jgi:adenine-specific DNA-methyltransferase
VINLATGIPKNKWSSEINNFLPSGAALDVKLTYEGKREEQDILMTEPASIDVLWRGGIDRKEQEENFLYYGDNMPILVSLLQNPEIRGKVKLIYIDPPFATNSIFQSRAQGDGYRDLLVGAHYIEFLRERLILLRELLAKDGSIYIHLDENIAFHIKVIMDEIFGKGNFRNWITRKKCNPKNYTRKTYGNISDFILFYTKSDTYTWNRSVEEWTDEHALKEYPCVEKETGRRYKKVPVHAPGVRNGETGMLWHGMLPPPGKHWQFTPQKLDEMDARGEIYWSPTGNPRRKVYFESSNGVPVQDIWLDFRDAHNQNIEVTGYPTEKNPELLTRIIEASSNPGDLVLDCFSGSGTTLAVASQLKRRWIGIDNGVEAIATTLRRFAQGLEPMGDFVSLRQMQVSPTTSIWDTAEEPVGDFVADRVVSSKEKPIQKTLLESISEPNTEQTEVKDKKIWKVIYNFNLCVDANSMDGLVDVIPKWLELQSKKP